MLESRDRLLPNRWCAPLDSIKNAHMGSRHANEIVATILGWAEHDVEVVECCVSGFNGLSSHRGAVRANQHGGPGTSIKSPLEETRHAAAQVTARLRFQLPGVAGDVFCKVIVSVQWPVG